MDARSTRQYWEGQYDATIKWANILDRYAKKHVTSEELKRLAAAARTNAISIGRNKLRNDNGQHPE